MAKITLEEQPEFAVLPDDSIIYVKVDDLSVREVDGQHGPWQKLEFTFKILGIQSIGDGGRPEDYESLITSKIWGSVPFKLTDNPENKLRLWAEAILGVEMGVGFELDTDMFQGREVRAVTTTYEKKKAGVDPRTGKYFRAHQVGSLLPKGGGHQAQYAPQAQPQQAPAQPQGYSYGQPPQPQAASAGSWGDDPGF